MDKNCISLYVNDFVCIRKRPYDDCGKCGEIVLFSDKKAVNDGR